MSIEKQFSEYETFHRNAQNHLTHMVGIPLIIIAILGLLSHIKAWPIASSLALTPGMILWVFYSLVATRMSFRLSMGFNLITLSFYFLAQTLSNGVLWILFILGWGLQLAGHHFYEKKKPAFLTNLKHLVIGPLWVYCRIFRLDLRTNR